MKFALCLALCFGLALATVDQWRWTETFDDILDTENYYGSEYGMSLGDKKTCRIGSRTLKTFEEDVKEISLPTVFKTVLKDCSTSYPRYAVLVRKLKPFSDLKIVKVATRTNNILLVPVSEFDDQVKVIVDGRRRLINRNIEVIPTTEQNIKLVKIGSIVKVILPSLSLVVEFDGKILNVKVPTMLSHQHCGVCSRFFSSSSFETDMYSPISSISDEFFSQDFLPESFISSEYPLKDEVEFSPFNLKSSFLSSRCPRRSFFNLLNREDDYLNNEDLLTKMFDVEPYYSSSMSSPFYSSISSPYYSSMYNPLTSQRRTFWDLLEDNEFITPLMKRQTIVRRKIIRTDGQVCLSIQRVPQCPINTYPQNEVETRITYKCVYPEPRLIQNLMNRLRTGHVMSDLSSHITTRTRVEVVPTMCLPNY